jgi:hypothetical protein
MRSEWEIKRRRKKSEKRERIKMKARKKLATLLLSPEGDGRREEILKLTRKA